MNITIRKAKKEDFESYYRLWYQMEMEHQKRFKGIKKEMLRLNKKYLKENLKKSFLKIIRRKDDILLMASKDNKVIGLIEFEEVKLKLGILLLKKQGNIRDIVVDKKYEGRGIASALKKESDKWFKKNGIKFVTLRYDPDNKHAAKVYKKWGFVHNMDMMVMKLK